jgi:predicted SPOUT superfamily RNA methylase MTH1
MLYNTPNIAILINKQEDIKTGIVQKAMKNSKYLVCVGKSHVSASSTEELFPGQRIVVGKSSSGWVVINSQNISSPTITSVKITG